MVAVSFEMDSKPERSSIRRRSTMKHTPSTEDLLAEETTVVNVDALPTYYTALRITPLAILLSLAGGIAGPIGPELYKARTCEIELNFTHGICVNLQNYTLEAREVQRVTSHLNMYDTLVGSLPAMFFTLFLGSWSDEYGRKLLMLLPIVGLALASGFTLMFTYIHISPYYLLIGTLIMASAGGGILISTAQFSYIGDYTNDSNRSANFAIVDAISSLVSVGGTALSGQLMTFGESVPFYVVLSLHACAFLYVLFVIHELKTFKSIKQSKISDILTLERVKDSWRTLGRRRPGHNRLFLLLTMGSIVLFCICVVGDMSITQMYLEFAPFNWSFQQYTIYMSVTGVIDSVVMVLANIVLSRFFTISDTMLGTLSSLSAIAYLLLYGIASSSVFVAYSSTIIYIAAGVGVLKMLGQVTIKSVIISLIDRDEIGKVMSTMMSLASMAPFLGVTIFTNILTHTNDWWPGLCFVLGSCMALPVVVVFLGFHIIQKRQAKKALDAETLGAVYHVDDASVKTKI